MERKWWVFLSVGAGGVMASLNTSVINIVLPIVSQDLGTDVATIEWVVTIYLLVISGLLLSFGRLGDLRGYKLVYVWGYVLFLIASPLCGLAPNELVLVGFRALQAVGGAMIFSNSSALLTKNFPAAQRGLALGLQSMTAYVGLTLGPSLGGLITSWLGWRAVFFANVPLGLAALYLGMRFIPTDVPATHAETFDIKGAALFMIGLILLMLGLNQGYAWGWTSPVIVTLLLAAAFVLGIFLWVERGVVHPMLDLSLFNQRLFTAAVASAIFNYICMYSVLFLMPFYLIQGRSFSPEQAGLLMTAQPLIMAITAPLSGMLSDRIGSRLLGTSGMITLAIGMGLLSRLNSVSPQIDIVLGLAIVGLGTGLFSSPNNNALMGAAPGHRQGIAAGIIATARNVGMVLGVGLAGAIFSTFHTDAASSSTLFDAISAGLLVSAVAALLGAMTSAIRGSQGSQKVVES